MLLTRASEYALLSIVCLNKQDVPVDAQALSIQLNISRSFLAKILQRLTKAGILVSYKGMRGGFALAKKSNQISILDIVRAVEDSSPSIFDCSSGMEGCANNRALTCSIWPLLCTLQVKVDDFLATVKLSDICANEV
jgi:Rrf2 family iron-sulfur cluster assembly transcriptional regulator